MGNGVPTAVRRNIRNFLLVLASASLFGLLTSLFFVVYYSPNENYLAKNAIISPKTAATLKITFPGEKNSKQVPFSFSDISFSYKDTKVSVKLDDYQKFYDLVSRDESDKKLAHYFNRGSSGLIEIHIKDPFTEVNSKVLQLIEIEEAGNHYRVELFHADGEDMWAYFSHPGILDKAKAIFIKTTDQ